MTRNSQISYTQYVHEFTNERGETRYAVADQRNGQYTRPVTEQVYKDSGCSTEVCQNLNAFGGYIDRTKALRRARYLFSATAQMYRMI